MDRLARILESSILLFIIRRSRQVVTPKHLYAPHIKQQSTWKLRDIAPHEQRNGKYWLRSGRALADLRTVHDEAALSHTISFCLHKLVDPYTTTVASDKAKSANQRPYRSWKRIWVRWQWMSGPRMCQGGRRRWMLGR